MKKFRLAKLQLTSDTANRSGLQTVNMTSSTPNTVTGTTFKNVLVDETGEFVVSSAPVGAITEVYRGNTAPATPSTGWLRVDTSGSGEVLKQWNGTARSELDHLSYISVNSDTTLADAYTLVEIDQSANLPITITIPSAGGGNKGRRIELFRRAGSLADITLSSTSNFINTYAGGITTYVWKSTVNRYFMSIRSNGVERLVDDDNIYNRVANTLFVDLKFGHNTFAAREFESRPFATVAAAITASQPGDTIVLRSGTYAIGNITTVHNLNFQAEAGVIVVSGSLIVNSNNTVTWTGGIYNGTAATSEFFTIGDGTIYFDFESITTAGKRFVRNISQATLSPKIYGRANTLINSALGVANDFAISLSAGLGAGLTNIINPIIDVEFDNVIGLGILYMTNSIQSPYININFDKISFEGGVGNEKIFHIDGAPILNLISNASFYINGNYIKSGSNNLSSNALFLINSNPIGNQSNATGRINVSRYEGNVGFFLDNNCANSEIHINGDYHYSSNRSLYVMYQANGTGAPVTKSSTLYNHTRISEVNGTGIAGRAGATTPGAVFIVAQGASYICDSLENKSLQYVVGGVDNQAVGLINDNYTDTYVKFYGTKLSANNLLAGSTGLMYNDGGAGANNHGIIQYEFHNGCQFELLGNAVELISGNNSGGPTIPRVVYTDDFTTNKEFNYGTSIEAVEYRSSLISIIPASGTYTVKDSEKDLYYDLTLGSLTLVLPDPAKFVNRELSIKVTGLHATNTITIDPVGAALIDGSATFTFGAITNLPNYTIKSDGTGRWIK